MNTRIIDKSVIEKFIERRKKDGLAESTINTETILLNDFYCWIKENKYHFIDFNIIDNYTNQLECGNQLFAKIKCTLIRVYDYILNKEYKIVTCHKEKIKISLEYEDYFNNYITIINNKFDRTTINNKKIFLKYFFNYLEQKQIKRLSDLKQYNITEFLNNCISKYSKAYFNKIAYFIREYLNYLFENNVIDFTGNDVIPKLNACFSTPIPTTYSVGEIRKMLNSINRTTKVGKRDYLILLLLSSYGIRIGDICNMKIKNFNFKTNKLTFIQKKTNKMIELPLFDEIKYAFIDYLKNSRPKFESKYLLITYTKPYRKYDKRGLRDIVPKYLKLADINTKGKKKGAHTLRHSLASNMLYNGSNIKQISDVLGHSYINTSNLYLTINVKKLQELSLELPKKLSDCGDLNE